MIAGDCAAYSERITTTPRLRWLLKTRTYKTGLQKEYWAIPVLRLGIMTLLDQKKHKEETLYCRTAFRIV